MRVALLTHGCRLNQSESDAIASGFSGAGHEVGVPPQDADLLIVNTCTVTAAADRDGRRLVRQWVRRLGPGRVVVTGCSAQRDPASYSEISGVRLVAGNAEKSRLISLLGPDMSGGVGREGGGAAGAAVAAVGAVSTSTPSRPIERLANLLAAGRSSHARAYLRVQDGCNQRCTFCTLPAVRGRSASVPVSTVRAEATALAASGHQELVLTGAHLGSYGLDLQPRVMLDELIGEVLHAAPNARVRLSSLEPRSVTPRLLDLLRHEERLCPHLHLPLQSGDDRVLSRMQRAYRRDVYMERVLAAWEAVIARPEHLPLALGSDFIVGFPGEDDSAFGATLELIQHLPFTYGHVFPYSDRPGTPAAEMSERVPVAVARDRRRRLVDALSRKSREFRHAHVGRAIEIVVESMDDRVARGTSERFLEAELDVGAQAARPKRASRVRGLATEMSGDSLRCSFVPSGLHEGIVPVIR